MLESAKSNQAFRTISEVSEDLAVPQHVLRFWETKFSAIRPLKRGGNRRYYRPEDIQLLRAINKLLYVDGYTIRGVQKLIREKGVREIAAQHGGVMPDLTASQDIVELEDFQSEPAASNGAAAVSTVEAVVDNSPALTFEPLPETEQAPMFLPLSAQRSSAQISAPLHVETDLVAETESVAPRHAGEISSAIERLQQVRSQIQTALGQGA
jgi:DNA-binding transcriptional MerR regulator